MTDDLCPALKQQVSNWSLGHSLSFRCSVSLTLCLKKQRERFRWKFCCVSVQPATSFISLNQEVHTGEGHYTADESWVMSFHLAAERLRTELRGGGGDRGGETQTVFYCCDGSCRRKEQFTG